MKKAVLCLALAFMAGAIFGQVRLPTVAITRFDTVGAVTQDEVAVVTELFTSFIAESRNVNLVDRSSFDLILQQMQFQASDWSDNAKAAQLGRALNAQYIGKFDYNDFKHN